MPRLVILGTSGAISSSSRDNTFMVLDNLRSSILIDCAGSPVYKLSKAKVDYRKIASIIITHTHIDHIYGLPSIIHSLWLEGRKKRLDIFCPQGAEKFIQNLIKSFSLLNLPSMFDIRVSKVGLKRMTNFIKGDKIKIYSIPVKHNLPAMGLKIMIRAKTIVYSGDTAPVLPVIKASHNVDYLIHECNFAKGESLDHTNLKQIGEIIKKSRPKHTILVHLNTLDDFKGWKRIIDTSLYDVQIAKDFLEIKL